VIEARKRIAVRVEGIVQGVGFRPFVHSLAQRLSLDGSVWNDADGVVVEIEGSAGDIDRFVHALTAEAPPLAVIIGVETSERPLAGTRGFSIEASRGGSAKTTPISPDVATCDDCLRELFDPSDRRYLYAFVNCTNCGPRYTIVLDVPYDRPLTTMAGFPMCDDCRREYEDPSDRRFHAQPIACPRCGPKLTLFDGRGMIDGDPIAKTAELLRSGKIVAIKGLGGFHLAADARDESAVAALRARKHREEKPFAVMAQSIEAARELVAISADEEKLLASIARPIVLLERLGEVAPSVAPHNRYLGVMLPYTPLHHLLLREIDRPIVLTSGNLSDEPIVYRDGEAEVRLSSIADAYLTHDRPIHIRTDDSVVRVFGGASMPLRRSRGYAPRPIVLKEPLAPVLACGAELKSTICAAKGKLAYLSHHLGDLENYESYVSFTEAIEHVRRLFDVVPSVIAHDLHPEYLSTKWAMATDAPRAAVQHHHAHIVSCLADNGEPGPAIGVAYDGLGYGTDGTLWGGEILVADRRSFERAGHWSVVPMPGGTNAIKEPWRMAAAYLDRAFGGEPPRLAVAERSGWDAVLSVARSEALSPRTSSMGRLFDAVAAITRVRDVAIYEGQAAIELEQRVDPSERGRYTVGLRDGAPFELSSDDVIRAVAEDVTAGVPASIIAARFHHTIAEATALACRVTRDRTGLGLVALSGGVFQNVTLLDRTVARLSADGFRVLVHRQVPANDGGISLGQAVIAASR
jgi:hydrogenase maturation protein HypF